MGSTNWNHRPLGVQVLGLAYRSGEAWNEAGFENADFDNALTEALAIADVEADPLGPPSPEGERKPRTCVLPARATGAIGVNAKVIFFNFNAVNRLDLR